MRSPIGETASLDTDVLRAFTAWDNCHGAISALRPAYDAALLLRDAQGGPDPLELRTQLHATQKECDQLFFRFLKVAEARTYARYI